MGGGVIVTNDDYLKDRIALRIDQLTQNSKLKIQNFKFIMQSLAYSIFLHPRLYWIAEKLPFLHLGETIYDPSFKIGPFTKIQAQQGLISLKRLKDKNALRQQRGVQYFKNLDGGNGIISPKPMDSSSPIYLRYPIFLRDKIQRDKAYQNLKIRGLGSHFMYPSPIGEIHGIAAHVTGKPNQEISKQIAERLLTLPTHTLLRKKDIEEIEKILK